MESEKKFRDFLNHYFGNHITLKLLEEKKLCLKKGRAKDLYQGNLEENEKQVLKLVDENYHNQIKNNRWAFDFPGWIGELNLSEPNVKEILVVGMEPHIGEMQNGVDRTAQVTYGLRETEKVDDNEIYEYSSNIRLWRNLNLIFGTNDDFKNRKLLEKIYITDLSHFAVKGTAKKVLEVKEWKKIRNDNADKYIRDTIKQIRPKYIISQGRDVASFIEKLISKEEREKMPKVMPNQFLEDKNKRFVNFPILECFTIDNQKIIHVRLPHLASPFNSAFWLEKEKDIDNRLKKFNEIKDRLKEFEKSL